MLVKFGVNEVGAHFFIVRLGIVAFVIPFVFIYDPKLLLIGAIDQIVLSILTALLGVFALAVALEGYLFSKCNGLQRILAALGGTIMIIPGWQTEALGAGLLLLVFLWQVQSKKERIPGIKA